MGFFSVFVFICFFGLSLDLSEFALKVNTFMLVFAGGFVTLATLFFTISCVGYMKVGIV